MSVMTFNYVNKAFIYLSSIAGEIQLVLINGHDLIYLKIT